MTETKYHKIVGILFCYSIIVVAYPYIRFNNNWTNNDFVHQVPKLAAGLEAGSITYPALSGNSLLYQASIFIIHEVTNATISQILLHIIPFTVGIGGFIVLVSLARSYTQNPRWAIAVGAFAISPLIGQLRASGKHSPFTYSLFFLIFFIIADHQTPRKRLLIFVLIPTLVLFHIYVSSVLVLMLLLYYIISSYFNLYSTHPDGKYSITLTLSSSLIVGWISYLFYSPVLIAESFLIKLIPPYSTSVSASPEYDGAIKAGAGIEQYFDVLALRWEPWWMWLVLTAPLFLFLVVGGVYWLWTTKRFIKNKMKFDQTYGFATVGGLVGTIILILSIMGFSTNLIFRYLAYFIPFCIIFILTRDKFQKNITSDSVITILLICLLVFGMIVTPVKISREPAFQEVEIGTYTDTDVAVVNWSKAHSCDISVENRKNAVAIYYIEFNDYRPSQKLPINNNSKTTNCSMFTDRNSNQYYPAIYSNGGTFVIQIHN